MFFRVYIPIRTSSGGDQNVYIKLCTVSLLNMIPVHLTLSLDTSLEWITSSVLPSMLPFINVMMKRYILSKMKLPDASAEISLLQDGRDLGPTI